MERRIPLPDDIAARVGKQLRKRLVRDLLPDLRGFGGHAQEKAEGLAVDGGGRVWVVTDNDGVKDATGETVFYSPGTARKLFGR
ncbi:MULTISPECIES: hypothetical protein [unclassified Spirillospora]|uniref:hypothetical protein n=1 Tax=unclassified Spirillospora TaxID=2642701 RepID=UPI003721AB4D